MDTDHEKWGIFKPKPSPRCTISCGSPAVVNKAHIDAWLTDAVDPHQKR